MPSHCIESTCDKWAIFGHVWGKGMYCKEHAAEGCVDVRNKRCRVTGCEKYPTHGPAGGQPHFCKADGEVRGFVDIKSKRCEVVGCQKGPSFGTPGGRPRFCKTHGEARGLINNREKRCLAEGCDIMPLFGPAGGKASHCQKHGQPLGYVNVKSTRCEVAECPTHGPAGNQPQFCRIHGEKQGFKNNVSKRCVAEGCDKIPFFGPAGEKASHCKKHGKPLGYVNVRSIRCQMPDCKSHATYGLKSRTPSHCSKHGKELGLLCLTYKLCQEVDCQTSAAYGPEGGKPLFCAQHGRPRGMTDVVNHRCKNGCGTMSHRNKYDGNCVRCFMFLHPDKPVSRDWKTKETHLRQHISELAGTHERLKGLQLTFDRALGGCSRRRPDALLECLSHAIVIECDENQHSNESSYPCENKRMMEIYQDIGHRPLVMIRFNPDKYVDSEGIETSSCFQYSKKEEVPLPQKKTWKARLNVLTAQILESVGNIPDKAVTIHHLYYDGFKTPA